VIFRCFLSSITFFKNILSDRKAHFGEFFSPWNKPIYTCISSKSSTLVSCPTNLSTALNTICAAVRNMPLTASKQTPLPTSTIVLIPTLRLTNPMETTAGDGLCTIVRRADMVCDASPDSFPSLILSSSPAS
jgi:hypothetical protein